MQPGTDRTETDWQTGQCVAEPLAPPSEPRKIDYHPDGQSIAVLTAQGEVIVADAATGRARCARWPAHEPHLANNH